ncbi:DUF2852 domain-containing protein [Roseobacter ponti]|uniref:DUF2852 domain-containing protein n=1 Tax=Roseobacter ponti TaxID=1891787 RepID=A0A858SRV2_9RHOB|nr:DUF2852 domain-containing protein [Roseobacter ponti]QJF51405.1 DUF2852 domain-containing protein [Roseobacter ponti]
MTTITHTPTAPGRPGWFARAEAWLDDRGKGAWIAAMVLSFILFWPVGLALLMYMIWSKRMFANTCRSSWSQGHSIKTMKSTGNSAFDAYKSDTLKRLEEEQDRFEAFLERLRDAKDKAEFDQFMEEAGPRSETRTTET